MIEDIFASLTCGMILPKLVLNQACIKVLLDEFSMKYVTSNTYKSLIYYNCLPFGVASTLSLFQRIMDNIPQGLYVNIYLDDILVSGKTPENYLHHLEAALKLASISNIQSVL